MTRGGPTGEPYSTACTMPACQCSPLGRSRNPTVFFRPSIAGSADRAAAVALGREEGQAAAVGARQGYAAALHCTVGHVAVASCYC